MAVMMSLFISAIVHWARQGSGTLATNWVGGQPSSTLGEAGIGLQIFQGICIGFLGVTGFETTPDYISILRPEPHVYPRVLLDLQLIAISINAPLLLVIFAVLPIDAIRDNSASILNAVALKTAGQGLALAVTVDAALILSGGIYTGLISASSIVEQLIGDGILPKITGRKLKTGALWIASMSFIVLCCLVWLSSGTDLFVISGMFAHLLPDYYFSMLTIAQVRDYLPVGDAAVSNITTSRPHQSSIASSTLIVAHVSSHPVHDRPQLDSHRG